MKSTELDLPSTASLVCSAMNTSAQALATPRASSGVRDRATRSTSGRKGFCGSRLGYNWVDSAPGASFSPSSFLCRSSCATRCWM